MFQRPVHRAAMLAAITLLLPAIAGMPTLERTISPGAGAFNGLEMALADFRGDGHIQVVAQSDDGNVYILDPRTGGTLARFAPGNAGCTWNCYSFEGVSGPINAPQVADLDNDGLLDIVLANTAAVVARYEFNAGASTSTHFVFDKKWEHRYNQYQSFTTMDASPALADLNGDGQKDIVVVTEELGVFAIRPDGSTLWQSGMKGGHASPSVKDLDGGGPEVVLASDEGLVVALNGANGVRKWTFDARPYVSPASIPMAPTLADISGDGHPDVLFMARDAHDATNFGNDHAVLFAVDSWGHLKWRAQPGWAPPLSHTRPIVVSVNGAPGIVGGTWNTIGHKPGNFERVGAGQVFLYDTSGREKWHRDLNAGTGNAASNKDFAVADVVGDGSQQVIAPGTQNGANGYLLFDLATGASKGFLPGPAASRSNVAVGNLFGDGRFAMAAATGSSIQVWHGGNGLSAAFPGWGARNVPVGHPPAGGNGTPPPPPPPGTFTAGFTPKGNEWWVEAVVSAPSHPVAGVSATVNGGAPVDLPATSWGTWAKSIHAASGAVVQFTARDAAGATVQSPCYHWVTFTSATCSGGGTPPPPPPPPPPGNSTFTATFNPHNGNEWWIQATVTANQPLAGVDAQVGTGSWLPMTHQSYGDWTVSTHAPAGSTVHLRARGTDGSIVASPAYIWPK